MSRDVLVLDVSLSDATLQAEAYPDSVTIAVFNLADNAEIALTLKQATQLRDFLSSVIEGSDVNSKKET